MVSMMSWRGLALVSAAVIALCAGMARADGERLDEDHEVSITCCVEPGDEPVEESGDDPTEEPGEGSGDDGGGWSGDDPGEESGDVGDGWAGDDPGEESGDDGERNGPVFLDSEAYSEADSSGGVVGLPYQDMVTMSATSVAEAALPRDAGPGESGLQTALGGTQTVATGPDGSVRGAGVATQRPTMTGGDCLTENPLAPLMLCIW